VSSYSRGLREPKLGATHPDVVWVGKGLKVGALAAQVRAARSARREQGMLQPASGGNMMPDYSPQLVFFCCNLLQVALPVKRVHPCTPQGPL